MNKQDNKLIAEFMEAKPNMFTLNKDGSHDYYYEIEFGDIYEQVIKPKEMQFNTDWNWLMPVVEKIESIDFVVSMRQSSVTIFNNSGKMPYFQPHSVIGSKIKSTYKAVVEFIKWYNKEK